MRLNLESGSKTTVPTTALENQNSPSTSIEEGIISDGPGTVKKT
jgi:hypothetical protein